MNYTEINWDFEHWDNGKVYLHNERWLEFRNNVDKYGNGYPHNWNNNRIFVCLSNPHDSMYDLPAVGDVDLKYIIESHEEWKMVYEPYPAFIRSENDPEGWLPSWHMWAEDRSSGEPLTIFETGYAFHNNPHSFFLSKTIRNKFASFRNQFWNVLEFNKLGIGVHPPPQPPLKSPKKLTARSIFEPFEADW